MIERLDLSDPSTAAQVLDVQHAAYRVEADLIGDDRIPTLHETLDELVAAPLQWFGIRDGGRVVAAMAVTGSGRTCDIDRLMVHPAHSRRGHGRHLVQGLQRHEWISVSTASANLAGRAFYEALGFRALSQHEALPGLPVTRFEWWNTAMATSFDADVELYERARPPYPDALWDRLADHGLVAGAQVLESGAGSGQATLPMLDRGAVVTCIEPGTNMAARLRQRVAGRACTVIESTLEDAAPSAGSFDMVVAGTSFHWVDATVGIPIVASAVRPDGRVALWWNVHRSPPHEDDPLSGLLTPIVSRFQTDERQQSNSYAFDTDDRITEITARGLLEMVDVELIAWPWTHDARSLRDLFGSYSDWITLPEPDRTQALDMVAALVDDHFGGELTRTYTTALYVARRT